MLNAPQGMALESLVFANCKVGMIGCTVKATGLGGMAFLRTQVNLGVATLSNTSVLVECSLLQCEYEGEPAFHLLGKNGAETAKFDVSELTLTTIGGASCPKTTKLDASYTILVPLPVFIQS